MPAPRTLCAQDTSRAAAALRRIDRKQLERVLGTAAAANVKLVTPKTLPHRTLPGIPPAVKRESTIVLRATDFLFSKVAAAPTRVEPPAETHHDTVATGRTPGPSAPSDAAPTRRYILPYRWVTTDAAGRLRVLRPVVDIEGGGLVYDLEQREYRGTALIGIEDSVHPELGTQPLVSPLRMQLVLTRPGSVRPAALAIDHTSLDYTKVAMEVADSDSVRIHVRTATDSAGVFVPVPVFGPRVKLTVLPKSIPAFGLGTATISVALPPGVPRDQRVTVRFTSPDVRVRPALLVVSADSANTATIRSGAPGVHTIDAEVDGIPADEETVAFLWPWLFVTAMLAGVALGAAARVYGAKRRSRATRFSRVLIAALPFGLLTAIAGELGLDWLQMKLDDPSTWAGVMLTAAIGAWLGPRVLERFTLDEPAAP